MRNLTFEDAEFYIWLCSNGFYDYVDNVINDYVINNEILSGIYLDLACCYGNIDKTLSCLHNYVGDNECDNDKVFTMVRNFLYEKYLSGSLDLFEIPELLLGGLYDAIYEYSKIIVFEEYQFYFEEGMMTDEEYKDIIITMLKTGEVKDFHLEYKKSYALFWIAYIAIIVIVMSTSIFIGLKK